MVSLDGTLGTPPPALPVGEGCRDDRLRLRKAQQYYWTVEAAEWRAGLVARRGELRQERKERKAWWAQWRHAQQTAWASRDRRGTCTVADFPLLTAQWPPNGGPASSVSAGDTATTDWICTLSKDRHRFASATKDRAQKGTACPQCLSMGNVGDVDELSIQLVSRKDATVGLSDEEPLSWMHQTWALNPNTGQWNRVKHTFTAATKSRFQQGDRCLVCAGFVVDATTSLRTWHPELAEELVEGGTSFPDQVGCTNRTTSYSWQCAQGHIFPATILNRVNGNGCPICRSMTPRVQAKLAAELLHACGIRMRQDRDPRLPDGVPDLASYRLLLSLGEKKRFGRRRAFEEIDILLDLPDGPVGVEYDGEAFHGGLYRSRRPDEVRKEEVLAHFGIPLVRVREGDLPAIACAGVVSVATTPTMPSFEIAVAVLKAVRNDFGRDVPGLQAYEKHGKARGAADAQAYLVAIKNVPRPRSRPEPKPRQPRPPRHVYPIGFRVGENLTVMSAPFQQEGRDHKFDSWAYEVRCTCGRTRDLAHWYIRNQTPKTCGACKAF
jgi:hypothetical protein